ncbi:MAG: tRNA (adenosine(37)-N6)-threonylcarbamoyltransferase complex dimerization subunit type 1 TsaB [Acidimicrobiia bacterium]|nr:tRNA (adenosine(37)-N6)-threonylcarbamoyltransferase complex dimerization subunit type 1 TsaB [Acidimicrobiia bacterium]
MKILGIETSTPASSVALVEDRQVVASASRVDRTGHGAFLVSAMDFCFDQSGWSPRDVDAIVVDTGPGLYTGIRVGLATAQGLAATLGVPVMPASSLNALALRAATGRRHIWSVVDVRRGEVAIAGYRPVPGGVVIDAQPELVSYDGFHGVLDSDPDDSLVVGDWQCLGETALRGLHRVKTGRPRYPSANALVDVAIPRIVRDDFPHPDDVRPMYMREPDVTISSKHMSEEGPWHGSSSA